MGSPSISPSYSGCTGGPPVTIGGATTVSFIIGAGLLPWVSGVIQRLGARVVLSGGAMLLGAGAIGLSHAAEPWQLYPCNLVMGFGWAG